MKKGFIWLLFILSILSLTAVDALAVGNGEVVQGRQTFFYNVQVQDQIKAMIFDVEWGLTPTLAFSGRYVYASPQPDNVSPQHYLSALIKFKLIENKSLNAAGRVSLYNDFDEGLRIQKTLGFVISKEQNSFLKTNVGFDYSLDTRAIGYFVGVDYKLTTHTYFQIGWEKFMTGHKQGLTLGIRTDL